MKLKIKQISTSRKELRVTLNPVKINNILYYTFGSAGGTFDEGTIDPKFRPLHLTKFNSPGPNPGIIRLIVAFLKDILGAGDGAHNSILVTERGENLPIVNIAIDDITLINLTSETIPSVIIKLLNPLPRSTNIDQDVKIEKRIVTTQEQDVYYISAEEPPDVVMGLAYDEGAKEEIGNPDLNKLNYQNYNELTGSFNHSDDSIIGEIISGSDVNLKIDYSKYGNHVHFGSAVAKLENFKLKAKKIENALMQVSKSLQTGSLATTKQLRKQQFTVIQDIKDNFTPYEKELYYKSDTLGYQYSLNLGPNYIKTTPLKKAEKLHGEDGFKLVYKVSGSTSGSGHIDLFKGMYEVEDKPFFNYSGSFYLSFLMRGDSSIKNTNLNGAGHSNIIYENRNQYHLPRIPQDALYTSSIIEPDVQSGSWKRYIYHASQSYWTPKTTNPVVGLAGGITDFSVGSTEVSMIHGNSKTGSHGITLGSRYTNLATVVTSSGISFTGSIVPAGELFRIYVDTSMGAGELTSSYLSDIKVTKYNPSSALPFSEIYRTGSSEFLNWYDEQYSSASRFDEENVHSLLQTLPSYLNDDNDMNNKSFRRFVNMMGEQFDLVKNYIDSYPTIFTTEYGKVGSVADNLLPMLAQNNNWQFMLPYGRKSDSDMLEFMGSTISNINNTSNIKNNIWRNIINNIKYIYKTKGTHASIRALLNSYGFPPDILKIKEHGASTDAYENTILSEDTSNLLEGLSNSEGNLSFTEKEDRLVSYIVDRPERTLKLDWGANDVAADTLQFVYRGDKSKNDQSIVEYFDNDASHIKWDIRLEKSGSTEASSSWGRFQFRLSPHNGGTPIGVFPDGTVDVISGSTPYYEFKNGKFWNVMLQRTSGSMGTSGSFSGGKPRFGKFRLSVGLQEGDAITTLTTASFTSTEPFHHANWSASSGLNELHIGRTFTGSIAEVRAWTSELSMSKFKQHILDKKSVVGNYSTASREELIYHYRLNENWISGSSNQKFKDYNPNNIKDYSLDFSDEMTGSLLVSGSMYDETDYQRIQFKVKIGGSYEVNENNIIINSEKRFIDNLNPFTPNSLDVYHPLINKRKASSQLELTRSPQEVINDFIMNQIGNYDFNDLFADPQDINEGAYKHLENYAKEFFDHYNISLDVNRYIRAQAAIFNKELITSLKRLVPARAKFEKVGVELKPTFLDRQKIQNRKVSKELIGVGPANIKMPGTYGSNITDWDDNIYLGKKIDNLIPLNLTKDAEIQLATSTGSISKEFTNLEPLYSNNDTHIMISSATASNPTLSTVFWPTKESTIQLSNASGSLVKSFIPNQPLYSEEGGNWSGESNISIASNTGSIGKDFTTLEPLYLTKDVHFEVANSDGSIAKDFSKMEKLYTYQSTDIVVSSHTSSYGRDFTKLEPLHTSKDTHFSIASSTGSISKDFSKLEKLYSYHSADIVVSSHTGSSAKDFSNLEPLHTSKDGVIDLVTPSGSIVKNFTSNEKLYTTKDVNLTVASHTSSYGRDFTKLEPLHTSKDTHFSIASSTGSIAKNFTKNENLYSYHESNISISTTSGSIAKNFTKNESLPFNEDVEIQVSTASGSIKNFTENEKLYSYLDTNIGIASETGSIAKNLTENEPLPFKGKDTIEISTASGSIKNFTENEKLYSYHNTNIGIASETGSISKNFTGNEPLQSAKDAKITISSHTGSFKQISSGDKLYKMNEMNIPIASNTGSITKLETELSVPKKGSIQLYGNTSLLSHFNRGYEDLSDKWGTGVNDVYFINYSGDSGSSGDYNTYHYEKRFIFYAIGDVESISGSSPSISSSFETDYTGNILNGVYTASRDFSNQTLIKTNEFLGFRPLGTTVEFKPSSSIDFNRGKFIDETHVYPANHIFIVGSSRDSLSRLIYKGTQNLGGDIIESEAFTDIHTDAFYRLLTSGGGTTNTVNL